MKKLMTICMSFVLLLSCSCSKQETVPENAQMMIGENPVTFTEVEYFSTALRGQIINTIQGEYKTQFDQDFWSTEIDGVTHEERFSNLLIEELKVMKATEELLRSEDLLIFDDFDHFLEILESENVRREQAVENGEVIYGPVEYSARDFYDYVIANTAIEYKSKVIENGSVIVTDEMLSDFQKLDGNENIVHQDEDTVFIDVYYRPYVIDYVLSDEELVNGKEILDKVSSQLKEGKTKQEILAENDVEFKTLEFTAENKSVDIQLYTAMYYGAYGLANIGDVSENIVAAGCNNVVVLTDRQSREEREFSEYREFLLSRYMDMYFDDLVAQMASDYQTIIIEDIIIE